MELTKAIYEATQDFPREEIYGLTSQLRCAAVSIPSNIAEGQGRLGAREFLQFLGIARGSLMEVETQAILANQMEYLAQPRLNDILRLTAETGRLLNGLISSLDH
jgi:four helix bundle protein